MGKIGAFVFFCLTCFMFLISSAFAESSLDCRRITAPEVRRVLEEKSAMVVNVLSEIEHAMQHIPGSINIPITKLKTSDKLSKDKNQPIVFYCMGVL